MNEEVKKLKRAVIKEEFIAITGNFIDAVILNQFIYWSERIKDFDEYIKQENDRAKKCGQNPQDLTGGWIYKTADDMSSETMLGLSASNMRLHIKALEKAGFISERTNPKYKWDRTKQYRVNLNEIFAALAEQGYALDGYQHRYTENATHNLKNQFANIDPQTANIDVQTSPIKTAIPETTAETTPETTAETIVGKKERKPQNGYGEIINSYTENEELRTALWEFIKMRKLIKKPMTDRALRSIMNKLDTLASTDTKKIAILDQSIQNSWQGVFELRQDKKVGDNDGTEEGYLAEVEAAFRKCEYTI